MNKESLEVLRPFLQQRDLFVAPKAPQVQQMSTVTEFLDVLELERNAWRRQKQIHFHQNFGSEFTSGTSPTLFAMTVMVRGLLCVTPE